ncbi:hypothetical protein PMIN02_013077 [Paraphaeosphaeria minitans]
MDMKSQWAIINTGPLTWCIHRLSESECFGLGMTEDKLVRPAYSSRPSIIHGVSLPAGSGRMAGTAASMKPRSADAPAVGLLAGKCTSCQGATKLEAVAIRSRLDVDGDESRWMQMVVTWMAMSRDGCRWL